MVMLSLEHALHVMPAKDCNCGEWCELRMKQTDARVLIFVFLFSGMPV